MTGATGNQTKNHASLSPTPSATSGFTIAYEDDHLLVVDKPAGLVVHPARGHREGTLSQLLGAAAAGGGVGGDPDRPGIVHRLDRGTSGLLIVARSEEAHRPLQRALAERRIVREYLALVHGRPPARSGTIEAPIGRDPRVRTRMAVDGAHPREARTHFEIERTFERFTLLRLRLDTGRTHQIRVHLQAIGHPVAGDPQYGRTPPRATITRRGTSRRGTPRTDDDAIGGEDSAGAPDVLGLRRQFLHAARLSFAHPFTGAPIDLASPLPGELQDALARAGTAGGAGGRLS